MAEDSIEIKLELSDPSLIRQGDYMSLLLEFSSFERLWDDELSYTMELTPMERPSAKIVLSENQQQVQAVG
jgi:hypothetical protein